MVLGNVTVELALERFDPFFSQAMPASTGGLEMLFRRDADQLHRVFVAADLDRAFVAAVVNAGVIESIPKPLKGTFEKQLFGNTRSMSEIYGLFCAFEAVALWLVTGDLAD